MNASTSMNWNPWKIKDEEAVYLVVAEEDR